MRRYLTSSTREQPSSFGGVSLEMWFQPLRTDSSRTVRSKNWVAVPPVFLAGVAYYSTESGALVTALLFPPTFLWWPGTVAVLFGLTWRLFDYTAITQWPKVPPRLRCPSTAGIASVATIGVGYILLKIGEGAASRALADLLPIWGIPFIAVAIFSGWLWGSYERARPPGGNVASSHQPPT